MVNTKTELSIKRILTILIPKLTKNTIQYKRNFDKQIPKFIKEFESYYGTVLSDRIVDYLVYHIHRSTASQYPAKIIDSILSAAMVEKFAHRDNQKELNYHENKWLREELNTTREKLCEECKDRSEHPQAGYIYMVSEEMTKKRLHNTPMGFLLCQQTLGWSPLSPTCNKCLYIKECKIEVQKKFPELYRLRLEAENGNKE